MSDARACVNLTFHGIGTPARSLDPPEQDVWLDEERFASILDGVAARDDVRITFDDGNRSDIVCALPALRERGLTATFFVVAGRLGSPGFLDDDDVRELCAQGMTIGCHGMWHRAWRNLSGRELDEELVLSRSRIEEVIGQPVTQAACPFGSYDRRVLRALRHHGYRLVYTSDRGPAQADRWMQPRNTLRRADHAPAVEEILSLDRPLRRAVTRRARLAVKRWR